MRRFIMCVLAACFIGTGVARGESPIFEEVGKKVPITLVGEYDGKTYTFKAEVEPTNTDGRKEASGHWNTESPHCQITLRPGAGDRVHFAVYSLPLDQVGYSGLIGWSAELVKDGDGYKAVKVKNPIAPPKWDEALIPAEGFTFEVMWPAPFAFCGQPSGRYVKVELLKSRSEDVQLVRGTITGVEKTFNPKPEVVNIFTGQLNRKTGKLTIFGTEVASDGDMTAFRTEYQLASFEVYTGVPSDWVGRNELVGFKLTHKTLDHSVLGKFTTEEK